MVNLSLKSDKALLQIALDQEQEMLEKVEAVGKGWNSGLIISGPPGTGKSFTVKQMLTQMPNLQHTQDVFTEKVDNEWRETSRIVKAGPLVRKSRYAPWSLVRDLYRNPREVGGYAR